MQNQPSYITSKENRWIKRILHLREKKYREMEKAFWIEGERATRELIEKQMKPVQAIFIQEEHWDRWKEKIPEDSVQNIFLIPKKLASYISSTETFSGIGLIASIPVWHPEELLKQGGTFLYLDHIADPGNLGTIIRTAQAFSVKGVLLSPESADPFNPKVVRSAMGGVLSFPVISQVTGEELYEMAVKYGCQIVGASVKDESLTHYRYCYTEPQILVIGSEAFGISGEIDALCQNHVKIPINSKAESLNAAIACGIILSEINRQKDGKEF